jgi:hypothetical protein
MVRQSIFLSLFIHFLLQAGEPAIVSLKPPRIEPVDIAVATSCDRPVRLGDVNISIDQADDKTIVHCYGHGGFGISTLFGSVQEAISLLMDKTSDMQTPIRIIGSGCMGLTMAIELSRAGFTHITISTKEKYTIPSWRAGGFFDPGFAESDHRAALGLATYAVLYAIERGEHPYLTKNTVRRLPVYYPTAVEKNMQLSTCSYLSTIVLYRQVSRLL